MYFRNAAWLVVCVGLCLSPLAGWAQTSEEPPSPSDRLPFRPLLDDDRMTPPARGAFVEFLEEEEPIETDRDSFTPATSTVSRRRVIVESAYSFIDERVVKDTHSYPEFVARIGLTDWFEMRIGASYEVGGAGDSVSGGGGGPIIGTPGVLESESQVLYGFKVATSRQLGWMPRSAVILQGFTPLSGPEAASSFLAGYVWGWRLPNGWEWDSAIRLLTDEFEADRHNVWAPSTVLKIPVADRWNAHAEYFGEMSSHLAEPRREHYFSPGVHYLVTPNLEVGVRVGWGLNPEASNFFSNVGFGWRF